MRWIVMAAMLLACSDPAPLADAGPDAVLLDPWSEAAVEALCFWAEMCAGSCDGVDLCSVPELHHAVDECLAHDLCVDIRACLWTSTCPALSEMIP